MIDLHTHTTFSDGSLTPTQLVAAAAAMGLSAVAITDHDTLEGLPEALAAGRRLGLRVVPGVEINLEHERVTMDMLGYFLGGWPGSAHEKRRPGAAPEEQPAGTRLEERRPSSAREEQLAGAALGEQLAGLRRSRDERNASILTRLAALGVPLDPGELAEAAGDGAAGRPHIGLALMRRGYVDSVSEAFRLYLQRGAPAWVDRSRLSLPAATRLLTECGGLAVLAHPGLIRTDPGAADGLARLVGDAVEAGIAGLECYHPSHDEETIATCLALAARHDLVVAGGSDYHGTLKPGIRLGTGPGGMSFPDEMLAELTARADPPQCRS